jgi:hypothetical protein
MFLVFSCTAVFAARDSAEDLVSALEKAVSQASHGDIAGTVRAMNAEARTPKGPKEVAAQIENFKEAYQKIAGLGEADEVERLSLRYTGDSFFRLRIVDKRAEGAILWTFIGYKFKGLWSCKGVTFNGGEDLMQIMRQELDAADAK